MVNTEYIRELFKEHEELTPHEAAEITDWPVKIAQRTMYRMMKQKEIYIIRYIRTSEGQIRPYPRAVYAVGDKPNAKRLPRLTGSEMVKRYREKRKGTVNSIFALAGLVEVNRRKNPKKSSLPFNWDKIRKNNGAHT